MSGISYMTEDMYSQAEITEYYTVGGRFMPTRRTASYIYIYIQYIVRRADGSASKVLVR